MYDERYNRQMMLPQIGVEGQKKLSEAKVLIVGVGGLGSAISIYLAGAGVGTIGLMDFDTVSKSNLQRQVLYSEDEIGILKVVCAKQRLVKMNSEIKVHLYDEPLTEYNADKVISDYDIVLDGCDNLKTRYVISDTCVKQNKPYIYGAISEFGGQVAVLCKDGGKSLRDLFDNVCPDDKRNIAGVIGITPGIVGVVQANQALQLICGFGEPLVNKLWVADFLTMNSHIVSL